MPVSSRASRVSKKSSQQVRAAKPKTARKIKMTAERRAKAAAPSLLVSEFAVALGQARAPRKRGSLQQALAETQRVNPVSVMAGVQVAAPRVREDHTPGSSPEWAPYMARHPKRKAVAWLARAGAWSLSLVVTAVIVTLTAAGLVANGSKPEAAFRLDLAAATTNPLR